MDQAFLLQGLHGRPSADELLEPVLDAAAVGAVRGAVFELGAGEHVWMKRRRRLEVSRVKASTRSVRVTHRITQSVKGPAFSLGEGLRNKSSLREQPLACSLALLLNAAV